MFCLCFRFWKRRLFFVQQIKILSFFVSIRQLQVELPSIILFHFPSSVVTSYINQPSLNKSSMSLCRKKSQSIHSIYFVIVDTTYKDRFYNLINSEKAVISNPLNLSVCALIINFYKKNFCFVREMSFKGQSEIRYYLRNRNNRVLRSCESQKGHYKDPNILKQLIASSYFSLLSVWID